MDKKSRELVMGKLYFSNKDYKMAEKSLNEYLAKNPEDAAALRLLAQVYEQSRRFDKAFEMYESCYLAEPERTGVLLDICRILIMNEVWLEHVDYRKWLNLAIKNFPSNPIVVNFKAFLATIPQNDSSSPQREVQPSITMSRPSGGDDLTKILEKLVSLDKRMASIENKLNGLTITQNESNTSLDKNTPSPKPTPSPASIFSTNSVTKQTQVPFSSPAVTPNSTNPQVFTPTAVSKSAQVPVSTPAPTSSPASVPEHKSLFGQPLSFEKGPFVFNKLESTLPKQDTLFGQPTNQIFPEKQPFLSESKFTFTPSFTPLVTSQKDPQPDKKTESPFKLTSLFSQVSQFPPTTKAEEKESGFNISTNLFADSIRKQNILTGESAWGKQSQSNSCSSPSKPKDENNDEENGQEKVPNEELAIEQTCDMTPIEIKTGEEDENILFEQRAKLYRFRDKEYKERGLGLIKVLKHKETGKGRLIMRREAIGLVCLNCWDCSKVERVRDLQIRWIGIDASDGEPEATVFLAKFKTLQVADEFMAHLTDLFSEESSSNLSEVSPKPDREN